MGVKWMTRGGKKVNRMRAIDADALIAQMEADAEQMEEPIAKMFAYAAISDIKHAPTIEPQRKKGKWIHDGSKWKNRWICSECGHIWMFEPATFCDKCGAEMEGAE